MKTNYLLFNLFIKSILIVFNLSFFSIIAAEVKTAENITIENHVEDDLYCAAGEIILKGSVKGDVNLAGGEIIIYSNISNDLNAVGGSIKVLSNVEDDVHITGGQITISKKVNGDVFIAGGDIFIDETAEILGTVYIAGGSIKIHGTVEGKTVITGGKISIAGSLKNDLTIKNAGHTDISGNIHGKSIISSEELYINKNASFHSPVEYWSKNTVDFYDTLKKGEAVFNHELKQSYHPPIVFMLALILLALASGFLIIYTINRFGGNYLNESSHFLEDNFITGFGTGALYFLVVPAVIFLLFISMIGIPFAIVFGFIYVTTLIFLRPITAVILSYWFNKKLGKNWNQNQIFFISFGILIFLAFISFIPAVGWLANAVISTAAFGSLIQIAYTKNKKPGSSKKKFLKS
ncbi:MAG: hypothetical protein OEZ22_09685 [Spirochaetia bacterium]|nr:hypothetical protein [Spirochaetia bacterium]